MPKPGGKVTIEVLTDTKDFEKALRTVSKHFTALDNELEEIRLSTPEEQ
jgi:hypothetical protein